MRATWKEWWAASRSARSWGHPNDRSERQGRRDQDAEEPGGPRQRDPDHPHRASQPVAGGQDPRGVLRESDTPEPARHDYRPRGALDHHPAMGPDDHRRRRESDPEIGARTEPGKRRAVDPSPDSAPERRTAP